MLPNRYIFISPDPIKNGKFGRARVAKFSFSKITGSNWLLPSYYFKEKSPKENSKLKNVKFVDFLFILSFK